MMRPTYKNLQRRGLDDAVGVIDASCSPAPDGNPRLWKYYLRVFSVECPWEDDAFFEHAPLLCNADCEKVGRLLALDQSCMVYGIRRLRADPVNPWDMTSARRKGVEFAMSYDEDSDPIVLGGYK